RKARLEAAVNQLGLLHRDASRDRELGDTRAVVATVDEVLGRAPALVTLLEGRVLVDRARDRDEEVLRLEEGSKQLLVPEAVGDVREHAQFYLIKVDHQEDLALAGTHAVADLDRFR